MHFVDWEDYFNERIIAQGEQYFLNSAVSNLVIKNHCATAIVSGTLNYRVEICFSGNEITKMNCTCPYCQDEGYDYKHMVAVILALINGNSERIDIKKLVESARNEQRKQFLQKILENNFSLALQFKTFIEESRTEKRLARRAVVSTKYRVLHKTFRIQSQKKQKHTVGKIFSPYSAHLFNFSSSLNSLWILQDSLWLLLHGELRHLGLDFANRLLHLHRYACQL